MILHNKKLAAVALAAFATGAQVAEGQDNKLGGNDGKAWVKESVVNGRLSIDIKPADVEFVHYNPQTRKVVPASDVRSVNVAGRGETPRYEVRDAQGTKLASAFVNTGSTRDGLIQDSDINDLRAQGYKYQEVLEDGQREQANQFARAENERAAQQRPAPAAAAPRTSAPPQAVASSVLMADLAKEARSADGAKVTQAEYRTSYRQMLNIEAALGRDPQASKPETQAALREAIKGPNADILYDYARDRMAGRNTKTEHAGMLQARTSGSTPPLKIDEAPVAAQQRPTAPAQGAPRAPAGISAQDFNRSLPNAGPAASAMAIGFVDEMSPAQVAELSAKWESAHPGAGKVINEARAAFEKSPQTPASLQKYVDELNAVAPMKPQTQNRNSSEAARSLPRVAADQGRNIEAEVMSQTNQRLRERNPAAAAIAEAMQNGRDPMQALGAQATEGPVMRDGKATVVTLNDKPYVLWREQNGQHKLYDQADIAKVYDRTAADMQGTNVIGAVAIRQKAVEAENALQGHEPAYKVNVTNPANIPDPAIREAVQAELAQPEPQASNNLGLGAPKV